jgi:uncharacterized protein YdiU (UPF0061 family)
MQPKVAHWNLYCLGQALLPLLDMDEAEAALQKFEAAFDTAYATLMRAKLGLQSAEDGDPALMERLLGLMQASRTDFTVLFRSLSLFDSTPGATNDRMRDQFTEREAFDDWAVHYRERLARESSVDAERRDRMDLVNPAYVLRNWMAEEAISRGRDHRDYALIEELRVLLSDPFSEQAGMERYAGCPPDWAGAISVSCSS